MGRFTDALLHLEIARHHLILNETHDLVTVCTMDIIHVTYSEGNVEGAKLMLEKNAEIRGFLVRKFDEGKRSLRVHYRFQRQTDACKD